MEDYLTSRKTRGSARPIIMTVLASFLLGGALVGYGVYRYAKPEVVIERAAPPAAVPQPSAAPNASGATPDTSPTTPASTPSAQASEAADKAVARVAEQQGGLDQRLAAAEQRISRLDLQAQAAAGNAARAEGLLIAFSARRALDRGAQLGYLADQLRLRFGDAMPNAVNTIISFSRNPVTMDQLVAQLDGLAPTLKETDQLFSWARMRSELSQLFVIRRNTTPSPEPEKRIERAKLFLESGRVEPAIAEVKALPGADKAKAWISAAERYDSAQKALDLIETAAVLEPRKLRDGNGKQIEQASPADSSAAPPEPAET
ncbi:hypothetical protein GRI58_07620 [Porphyrobacter algicida]|uniref:Mitochondrial inner membrane protein n=1 Tax=Qipengyuania algicida TaxID=1836209 RepID=A0A845AGU0_9SPHN|nr:hypothetical protein [Qipengyuania algicida]MXP28687.1 hypothetical protein [Qipengyuania algicida]